MKFKILFLLTICITTQNYAQEHYPKKHFGKPLDIPMILAGTFGELRGNHFHSGIDIKTKNTQGLKVKAIGNGYVSRIRVSLWGYGKVLYITHPNGFTSVYGHLSSFSSKIQAYVKHLQYDKQTYEIQIFPKKGEIPIKKGAVIAYSGDTGGSTAPHLHFEIRNTKTEKPINPMLFGYHVADHIKPFITNLVAYPLNDTSQVNQSNVPVEIQFKMLKNGDYVADNISAYGQVGFGIKTYDRQDAANNRNGIYDMSMFVNGTLDYHHKMDEFSFSNTKYINLFMDYKAYFTEHQAIQKCFIEPNDKLDIYDRTLGNGYVSISDSLNYNIKIEAKDFVNNTSQIIIPVKGENDSIVVRQNIVKTNYFIDNKVFNTFKLNNIGIAFPKHTFYNDFYLDFKVGQDTAYVDTNTQPLERNYTLTFYTDSMGIKDNSNYYIASVVNNKYTNYVNTDRKADKVFASVNTLGTYVLKKDSILPTIELYNFKNKQWLTHYHFLKVKISDKDSGIKSYNAYIDDHWILMEYEPKTETLTYNFSDKKFKTAKHLFKLNVTDNAGNTAVYTATFFRKK